MEKYTPHYDLAPDQGGCQAAWKTSFYQNSTQLRGKARSEHHANAGGVYKLTGKMLFKSMTSYGDHCVWQDVYHIHSHGLEIYIKVTYRTDGKPPVISFKESNL